jgi:hypothetical protein
VTSMLFTAARERGSPADRVEVKKSRPNGPHVGQRPARGQPIGRRVSAAREKLHAATQRTRSVADNAGCEKLATLCALAARA